MQPIPVSVGRTRSRRRRPPAPTPLGSRRTLLGTIRRGATVGEARAAPEPRCSAERWAGHPPVSAARAHGSERVTEGRPVHRPHQPGRRCVLHGAGSGQWCAGGDTGACGAGSNTRLGPSLSSRRRRTPEGSGVRPTSARRRGRQGVRSDVRQDTEERVPRSAQGATWCSRSRRASAIDSCAVPRVLLVLRVAWPGQLSGCAGLPAMAAAAYRSTALVSGEPNTLL